MICHFSAEKKVEERGEEKGTILLFVYSSILTAYIANFLCLWECS